MAPWTSAALGLLLAGGIAFVVAGSRTETRAAPTAALPTEGAAPEVLEKDNTRPKEPAAVSSDAGGPREVSSSFDTLPSGAPVPKLPDSAPKEVSFGVALFQYAGAQAAPPGARNRQEALALARETVPLAQRDFAEAVKQGDRGSTEDAGKIPRGILEPGPEYQLFTLAAGEVCPEPVDTPRGYWVVRRR